MIVATPIDGGDRRCLAWLVLVVGVAHGLLVLNTGLYWDDYMLYDWLKERNWARLRETGETMGNLGYTYLYWPFRWFDDPAAAMKIAVFICLALTACLIYLAARETELVDRFAAFFVAAAAVIYPGHMMTFAANIAGHFLSYFAFALGAWCALRSEKRAGKSRHAYRAAAYASFVVSFFTPSFLVFHFGFLLLLFLVAGRSSSPGAGLAGRTMGFLARQWGLLLLPFAFWIVHEWLNPVGGWAKERGYNAIRLDPDHVLPIYENLLRVIAGQWVHYLEPYLACVALLLAAIWITKRTAAAKSMPSLPVEAGSAGAAVVLGAAWLLLAAFSYAAVGKNFGQAEIVDWPTRNRLLLQLPLGILLLGVVNAIFGRWPACRAAALGGVLIVATAIRVHTYIVWETQAIKDESIRQNIARMAGIRKYHLLAVHDRYVIVDPGWITNDIALWWSYVLKLALGDFTRIGLYERDYRRARSGARYTAEDISRLAFRDRVHPLHFDPGAPQASLMVERGPLAGGRWLMLSYYLARMRGATSLERFLSGVATITVTELN